MYGFKIYFQVLRTFSDLGGGKFRLFISKIYLKFRKETTQLINIIMDSYNGQKKFLILISKKNIAKNRVQRFYNFSRQTIPYFLSDFDSPSLILFVLKIHGDLPLEKWKNFQTLPHYS